MQTFCGQRSHRPPARAWRAVAARLMACWAGFSLALPALVGAEVPRPLRFSELAACPLVAEPAAAAAGEGLSEPIRAANGTVVRISGYMLPLDAAGGRARQFLLLRNQNACCFGQLPAANEYLVVEAPAPGLPVRMDTPLAFVGRLRVAPVVSGGSVVQFYNLDQAALAATP